jgi:hypothetical protein
MPVGAQAGTNLTTADASHALAISTTAVSRTPLEPHDLTAGASQRPASSVTAPIGWRYTK